MGANEMGVQARHTEVFAPATSLAVTADLPVDSLHHPDAGEIELAAVLHALSDPTEDHRPCGSFGLPVTKSTCTHHFKVLREAGVIRQRLEGTTRLNSLRRDDLEQRFPGLLESVLRGAV
jgi:DNA-binding transcriptional ArsR family regulator